VAKLTPPYLNNPAAPDQIARRWLLFKQLKTIIMLPNVRAALTAAIIAKLSDAGETWHTIQKKSLRDTWNCPAEHRTLYKICKDQKYIIHRKTAGALLDFFKIPYLNNYGVITLNEITEPADNKKADQVKRKKAKKAK